jgi:hypothetical protein
LATIAKAGEGSPFGDGGYRKLRPGLAAKPQTKHVLKQVTDLSETIPSKGLADQFESDLPV